MAESRDISAGPGDTRQAFEATLVQALRSKGNLLTLARCAKKLGLGIVEQRAQDRVSGKSVVTDIDRGRALWNVIEEAIERLRPADLDPALTPAWRLYSIVSGFYVQGKPVNELAIELGISPRTLFRERQTAVEALFTVIWQIEQQRHLLPHGNEADHVG